MKTKFVVLITIILAVVSTVDRPVTASGGNVANKAARAEKAINVSREVDSLLRVRRYAFIPDKALPQMSGARYVILTSHYEFVVTPDSLISILPYFGQAYSNLYFRPDRLSPLDFESTDFSYVQTGTVGGERKAVIDIRTNKTTVGINYRIILEVYDNKTAMMSIDSPMATNLIFTGTITGIPDDK